MRSALPVPCSISWSPPTRSARAQVHGLWPSPMELEKQFNDLKHEPEFGMEYATEVSKFVAQGACPGLQAGL